MWKAWKNQLLAFLESLLICCSNIDSDLCETLSPPPVSELICTLHFCKLLDGGLVNLHTESKQTFGICLHEITGR